MSGNKPLINAGKYNHRIQIVQKNSGVDEDGFPVDGYSTVLETWASVNTTSGMTLIANDSTFEKAYTRFTIRYPQTKITRKMHVLFGGVEYSIEYLNNVNHANTELEIQAKEVNIDG
jgi:SPP1 family predicted phage head-tail adaptor